MSRVRRGTLAGRNDALSVGDGTVQAMDESTAAEATATYLRAISDDATTTYRVQTVTGTYLLDLRSRRLLRIPNTIHAGDQSLTLVFDVDGAWLPLVELRQCRVGEPMRATVTISGAHQPLRTSPVRTIAHATAGREER